MHFQRNNFYSIFTLKKIHVFHLQGNIFSINPKTFHDFSLFIQACLNKGNHQKVMR